MKISRAFILVAAALVIGFAAARWCTAQSAHQPASKEPAPDYNVGLHQLEDFVEYLQDTKQTNTLQRFNDYCNTTVVSQCSADMGVRVHMLYYLRSGRTNEVIHLLEQMMTGDAVGFATSYRELPAPIRNKVGLTAFREVRDYCRKYPVNSGHSDVDDIVEKAFTLLDEKSAH